MNINLFAPQRIHEMMDDRYEFLKDVQRKIMLHLEKSAEIKVLNTFDDEVFLHGINILYFHRGEWKEFFNSDILYKSNSLKKMFIISANPKLIIPHQIPINNLIGVAWYHILTCDPKIFASSGASINGYAYDTFYRNNHNPLSHSEGLSESPQNYKCLTSDTDLIEKILTFLKLYIEHYELMEKHIDNYVLHPIDNESVIKHFFRIEKLSLQDRQVIELGRVRFYASQSFEERAKEVNEFFKIISKHIC